VENGVSGEEEREGRVGKVGKARERRRSTILGIHHDGTLTGKQIKKTTVIKIRTTKQE
jgi:hypothetical protein